MTKERVEFERALTRASGLTPLEEALLIVQVTRRLYGGEWAIWTDGSGQYWAVKR